MDESYFEEAPPPATNSKGEVTELPAPFDPIIYFRPAHIRRLERIFHCDATTDVAILLRTLKPPKEFTPASLATYFVGARSGFMKDKNKPSTWAVNPTTLKTHREHPSSCATCHLPPHLCASGARQTAAPSPEPVCTPCPLERDCLLSLSLDSKCSHILAHYTATSLAAAAKEYGLLFSNVLFDQVGEHLRTVWFPAQKNANIQSYNPTVSGVTTLIPNRIAPPKQAETPIELSSTAFSTMSSTPIVSRAPSELFHPNPKLFQPKQTEQVRNVSFKSFT